MGRRRLRMFRQVAVGLGAGLLFLVLDGVIHANPLAQRLYAVYEPLARPRVNALLGSAIDLAYGVVLAVIFVRLFPSLPGSGGVAKGLSFGLLVWFFRVVMSAAGEWITKTTPPATHAYVLLTGLVQITVVSVFLGALLTPGLG
jgi:hypothetical protein